METQGTGEVIPGATVRVTGPASRTASSDASGVAIFRDLPAGSYTVSAEKDGLGDDSKPATVSAGVKVDDAPPGGAQRLAGAPATGQSAPGVTLQLTAEFIVLVDEGATDPQAKEASAAYDFKGDALTLKLNGGSSPARRHKDNEFRHPSNGATTADAESFVRTIASGQKGASTVEPIRWRVTGGAGLVPGTPGTVTVSSRLRLSLWSFNASFIDAGKSSPTSITLKQSQLLELKDARLDDFSLVRTITFDPAHPDQVAWGAFAPLGSGKLREPYLRELVSQLHAIQVQVMAGYEIVEKGKESSELGKAFNRWLNGATDSDLDKHAQAIADFLSKFDLDGINFDFEINALGFAKAFPNHKANLEKLYVKTAQKIAARNGMVSYDNAPDTVDGGNSNSFMKVQPLSLATKERNLIARPMCFDAANATSFSTVEQSIACALGDPATRSGGAGLHPSQIQYGIWTRKLGLSTAANAQQWMDLFRKNRIGVVLYNMDDQPGMLKLAKSLDALLNPGEAAPGTSGQPLQVPRK